MPFALLDLIFPPRCVHCHAYLGHDLALCAVCRRRIVSHRVFFCGKCHARRHSAREFCHLGFPFLLGAAGEYEDPIIKGLVRSLKFHFVRSAAKPLGSILAAYAARLRIPGSYDIILPMPLSGRRRRERGFNQSELIAAAFAAKTGVQMNTDVLLRERHSPPQSGLRGYAERRANVADCFKVVSPIGVRGRNIILLDDVVTSGTTMLSATKALRAAGARNILALAAAKA